MRVVPSEGRRPAPRAPPFCHMPWLSAPQLYVNLARRPDLQTGRWVGSDRGLVISDNLSQGLAARARFRSSQGFQTSRRTARRGGGGGGGGGGGRRSKRARSRTSGGGTWGGGAQGKRLPFCLHHGLRVLWSLCRLSASCLCWLCGGGLPREETVRGRIWAWWQLTIAIMAGLPSGLLPLLPRFLLLRHPPTHPPTSIFSHAFVVPMQLIHQQLTLRLAEELQVHLFPLLSSVLPEVSLHPPIVSHPFFSSLTCTRTPSPPTGRDDQ